MGLQRVGHNRVTNTLTHMHMKTSLNQKIDSHPFLLVSL